MSRPTIVSKRPVPNYIPEQTEITEITFDNGEVAVQGPAGGLINTYGIELDFWLSVWIGDFRAAVRLLDEDDYLKFGRVFEIMLQAFERNMEEVMHAVYENIGLITCEMIGVNDAPFREGRVVGTEFKPAITEKESET